MDLMDDLLGESPGIVAVRERLRRLLAQSGKRALPPLLILGETGTGKGLAAGLIHRTGPRASAPFISVNCRAIPDTLVEAELFGYERGAFTDARQAKAGLFQAANHGTFFLDEIGGLPDGIQAKLLKVIEERTVRRLGSTRDEPIDVAIVTATNEDLSEAVARREFRQDLYHRLAVLTVRLPPLRERGNDIVVLAERFLLRACTDYNLPLRTLDASARAALVAYAWPGNIRELANVIERVTLESEARVITSRMLGLPGPSPRAKPSPAVAVADPSPEAGGGVERERLRQALERASWNKSHAAVDLGVSRNTVRYWIEKHGLRQGQPAPPVRPPTSPAPASAPASVTVPPEASGPIRVRWDRRRVTLLRAALVPSSQESQSLYTARASEALVDKVRSFGGRVVELGPTGIVAAFGLEPLEDAPRHAAHAAMAIQKAAERARREGSALHLAVGIHVGQFLVGEAGGAIQIDLEAKREAWTLLDSLLASGGIDTVLVTEAAATFLERGFDLEPLGLEANGIGPTFSLTGSALDGPAFGRPMVPFVGRRHDLELLESRLATALTGRGQVVGIVGDAGLGKSRLVFEFRRALRRRPITWLDGRCLSYGAGMPLLPIFRMLRQNLGITDAHGVEAIADRVRSGLGLVGMDAEEWGPYLLLLLGVREGTERLAALAPEAVRSRTLEAIRQLILGGSRRRPLVLVLEDLHWIDRTSEEYVNGLVESLAGSAITFLATYRPGYRPAWMDRSYVTQIALQPLTEDESRSVVRSVLGTKQVSDTLARQVLHKAEGNPFFLEELAEAIRDQGDEEPVLEAPDTVQEVLLARIHRLAEGPRQALQVAAILGRESALRVLRSIWSGPDDLESHLRELMRLEFLFEHSKGVEPVFIFKHPLTQEVAYGSLPASERRALHGAAGRALEAIHAGRLADAYEQLAHHYARSDEHQKALKYMTLFASKAASLHAYAEAVRVLQEAQRHLRGLPVGEQERRRLDLVLRQAAELMPLGRLPEILELLLPEREAVEHMGDPALSGHYHFVLSHTYTFLDRERSTQHAELAIAEAERCGDGIIKGKAYCVLGQDGPFAGRALEGIAHGRKASELLQASDEHWWRGRAHWIVALNYCQVGSFDEAQGEIALAAAIAESTGDPRLQTCVAWCTGIIHAARGETDAGVLACRQGVERARDVMNQTIGTGWLGFTLMEKGETAEAIVRLDHAVKLLAQLGYRPLQGWFTAFLAEAYRLEGQPELARNAARKGLQVAADSRVRVAEGWARLGLGRIAIGAGAHAEAEEHLREARAAFEAVHSRYELGRTGMDLAVAVHAQGRRDAARELLSDAHALFLSLNLPHHARRAEQLDRDLGLSPAGADRPS
jgi:transcriptional regulator with AAA-type ATPase domain/tetratricopeptide (TPR) repeat protein